MEKQDSPRPMSRPVLLLGTDAGMRMPTRRHALMLALAIAAIMIVVGLVLARLGARQPSAPTTGIHVPLPASSPPSALPGAPSDVAAAESPAASGDVARTINDRIAFVADKGPAARPYRFAGSTEDRARARACLAAAALYEAGASDGTGQKAVIQVVLNRVRHPAFVPSICGVVFQGQERKTGCQFTFTCDGSMRFRFSPAQWDAALARADAALDGAVDATVGLSTHYHTDWVHPYWSTSLDKLTRVGTHLFFRWQGYWGTRPAFAVRPNGLEPRIGQLAEFTAHRGDDGTPAVLPIDPAILAAKAEADGPVRLPRRRGLDPSTFGMSAGQLAGAEILFVHPQGGAYLLAVPAGMSRKRFDSIAGQLCGKGGFCRVQAWADPDQVPLGFPIGPAARQAMRYEFVRDPNERVEGQS